MTTALSVRNATKIFGAQVALDNVSIDVQPGEVRALVRSEEHTSELQSH